MPTACKRRRIAGTSACNASVSRRQPEGGDGNLETELDHHHRRQPRRPQKTVELVENVDNSSSSSRNHQKQSGNADNKYCKGDESDNNNSESNERMKNDVCVIGNHARGEREGGFFAFEPFSVACRNDNSLVLFSFVASHTKYAYIHHFIHRTHFL